MMVKSYTQIAPFLKENLAFLEQNEAVNNLLIGIPTALQTVENLDPYPVLLSVFDENELVLTCIQTPPRNFILAASTEKQSEAIEALISFLIQQKMQVPGIIARTSLATEFAKVWTSRTNTTWKIIFNQLIYQLDKLKNIKYPAGKMRLARMEEFDLLCTWVADFLAEALQQSDKEGAKKMAKEKIAKQTLYVWEDGEVVSMAAAVRPMKHGIMVGYVYTPPAFRGRGYASGVVAELSALMLETYDFCALYADLANPTSNKIYARMGYQVIEESRQIEFGRE